MSLAYVHGYDPRENERLQDQAGTLVELLHSDTADSVAEARRRADRAGLANVEFRQADIFDLPFDPESFDHIFVCFVLGTSRGPPRPWRSSRGCSGRTAPSPSSRAVTDRPIKGVGAKRAT